VKKLIVVVAAVGLLALLALPLALGAGAKEDVTVRVVGIQVAGEGYGDDFQMQPFNSPGVSLVVLIETKGAKQIVKLDTDNSEITSFKDNKGTDLLKEPAGKQGKFYRSTFGWPRVSKDGKAVLVEVTGKSRPAKGSTSVKADVKAHLLMASEKKTERAKGVALKAGTEVKAGPAPLTVDKVQPGGGGKTTEVTLKSNEVFDHLIEVRFYKGAELVKSRRAGTMTTTMFKKKTVHATYSVKEKLDVVDIEVEYWADLATKVVPVKVEAGLGL